jgi:hypothetical protein
MRIARMLRIARQPLVEIRMIRKAKAGAEYREIRKIRSIRRRLLTALIFAASRSGSLWKGGSIANLNGNWSAVCPQGVDSQPALGVGPMSHEGHAAPMRGRYGCCYAERRKRVNADETEEISGIGGVHKCTTRAVTRPRSMYSPFADFHLQ